MTHQNSGTETISMRYPIGNVLLYMSIRCGDAARYNIAVRLKRLRAKGILECVTKRVVTRTFCNYHEGNAKHSRNCPQHSRSHVFLSSIENTSRFFMHSVHHWVISLPSPLLSISSFFVCHKPCCCAGPAGSTLPPLRTSRPIHGFCGSPIPLARVPGG